ncbi:MAG TPA: glycine zipper family protein [Methylomirabilota bacterium]|nr:glycine zipper family protein [Methylomirabilota bacterium]
MLRPALLSLAALLSLTACATVPTGPRVMVLPGAGKPFDLFQADDSICRQWAAHNAGGNPAEAATQSTVSGAAIGTFIGVAAGTMIGAAAGNPATGAAIGAGTGLVTGTAVGASAGYGYAGEAQRRYDIAYSQCMYAKGNQVPGVVRTARPYRYPPPPPPPGALAPR